MFKKIVSNLSFSPAVAGQLAFYAKRLRKEKLTRGLSLVLGVGVFALQFANIVAPPTSANALGPSDIIKGGVVSKDDLIAHIDGSAELQSFYHDTFGITDDNIRSASYTSSLPAQGSDKQSVGRVRHNTSDTVISTPYDSYFMHSFAAVATTPTARAYVGTTSRGQWFAILLSCGNPIMAGPPAPTPTPPALVLHKIVAPGTNSPAAGAEVAPGSLITYRFPYGNAGGTGALDAQIFDTLPAGTSYVSQSSGLATGFQPPSGATPAIWTIHSLGVGAIDNANLTVQIKNDVADGTQICNQAFIRAVYVPTVYSEKICHIVKRQPTPKPPVTPTTPNINQSKFAIYLTRTGTGGTPPKANNPASKAKSGDIIEYTLKTSNTGTGAKNGYQIVEDLTDILEYADVTNTGGGLLQGKALVWPAVNIDARTTITKTFQVTVKTPIPSTPRSTSDPKSFDLCMDNVYGDNVTVCVEAPPVKQVEVATQQLPQTGPGLNMGLVAGFLAMLAYFYARSRQLDTEVSILKVDHNPGVSM